MYNFANGDSKWDLLKKILLNQQDIVTAINNISISGGGLNNTNFVADEVPNGAVNGINSTFVLANTPVAGSVEVYLNGMLMNPGAGNDYQISGVTITFNFVPTAGGHVLATYRK